MANSVGQTQSPKGAFALARGVIQHTAQIFQSGFSTTRNFIEQKRNAWGAFLTPLDNLILRAEEKADKVIDPIVDFINRKGNVVGRALRLWGKWNPPEYDFSKCNEEDLQEIFNLATDIKWRTKGHVIKSGTLNGLRLGTVAGILFFVNPIVAVGVMMSSIVVQTYLRRQKNLKLSKHFNEATKKLNPQSMHSILPLEEEVAEVKNFCKEDLKIWKNVEKDPLRFSFAAATLLLNPIILPNALMAWAGLKDMKKNGSINSRATEIMEKIREQYPDVSPDEKQLKSTQYDPILPF